MKPQKQAALRSVQSVSMCTVAVSLYHHSLWSENVCGVIFPSCVCVCVFFTRAQLLSSVTCQLDFSRL